MDAQGFGETHDVAITVLVDNRADLIVKSTDTVKHFTKQPLLAEHGFAALVELKAAGRRILWDAGATRDTLLENARRMKVDLSTVDMIALSHGHFDHTGALTAVLQMREAQPKRRRWEPGWSEAELAAYAKPRRVPLVAHPAAFRERWTRHKSGEIQGPTAPPPRQAWEAAGAEIQLSEAPFELGPGCWTTGYVPRQSFEKLAWSDEERLYRDATGFHRDNTEDDQAIVINVEGKGLVILSGCAHAGIINTIRHARAISGVDQVWAILGGFHLVRSEPAELEQIIAEIKGLAPALISPSHCTGFGPIGRFAAEMPEQFVHGVVGATYLF